MTNQEAPTAEQIARDTYFNAQNGRKATDADKALIERINEKVVDLGILIELDIPAGRNKSLAKTALEDAQMRAVRAIFSPIG